jgi:thioredoxin reductase (NADPH)
VGLKGAEHLEAVVVEENGAQRTIETDYFIPFWSYAKVGSYWRLGIGNQKMP